MNNNRLIISILVLVLVLVGIGWFLSANGMLPGTNRTNDSDTRPSDYHAIFLSNGQVYFGKLSGEKGQMMTLVDVYYLQLAQAPQPEGQQQQSNDQNQQQQISLVKLGNELHGPVDEMKINRDHVLFIEAMKEDAKVVEAIERYKKEGPTNPADATSPAPETSATPGRR